MGGAGVVMGFASGVWFGSGDWVASLGGASSFITDSGTGSISVSAATSVDSVLTSACACEAVLTLTSAGDYPASILRSQGSPQSVAHTVRIIPTESIFFMLYGLLHLLATQQLPHKQEESY